MNPTTRPPLAAVPASTSATPIAGGLRAWFLRLRALLAAVPYSALALLGRFSIAAVFWKSAQTKVEGFAIDLVSGEVHLGIPHLSASAVDLFREEYKLPLLSPEFAAPLTAVTEHVFSALILLGLATRFSALGLLGMTLVIELFVYPDAYPTHGVWATVLLLLITQGPGRLSIDHWIAQRYGVAR